MLKNNDPKPWSPHDLGTGILLERSLVSKERVGKPVHILRRLKHDDQEWQPGTMPWFEVRIAGEELNGNCYPAFPGDAIGPYVEPAPEFVPFPKIARLNREVVITEKIDGTNAQVHVAEDGTVRAGSRTRWITPTDDNFGFAAWVAAHADELRALGPGSHFGEWWGSGVQRGYGLEKGEKRFSLFNVHRWGDGSETPRPACCHVVPVLTHCNGSELSTIVAAQVDLLRNIGSRAAPGFMKPEGIAVFHSASGNLYKVTLERDEAPKGQPQ